MRKRKKKEMYCQYRKLLGRVNASFVPCISGQLELPTGNVPDSYLRFVPVPEDWTVITLRNPNRIDK